MHLGIVSERTLFWLRHTSNPRAPGARCRVRTALVERHFHRVATSTLTGSTTQRRCSPSSQEKRLSAVAADGYERRVADLRRRLRRCDLCRNLYLCAEPEALRDGSRDDSADCHARAGNTGRDAFLRCESDCGIGWAAQATLRGPYVHSEESTCKMVVLEVTQAA